MVGGRGGDVKLRGSCCGPWQLGKDGALGAASKAWQVPLWQV